MQQSILIINMYLYKLVLYKFLLLSTNIILLIYYLKIKFRYCYIVKYYYIVIKKTILYNFLISIFNFLL